MAFQPVGKGGGPYTYTLRLDVFVSAVQTRM